MFDYENLVGDYEKLIGDYDTYIPVSSQSNCSINFVTTMI